LKVQSTDTASPLDVDTLIDSGATGQFIDAEFIKRERFKTQSLPHAIPVYNIDGTPNEASSIKEEVDLICAFDNHTEHITFAITSLGQLAMILGHTWLVKYNPVVNWNTGDVKMSRCPDSCGVDKKEKETSEFGDQLFFLATEEQPERINATSTISQQLAQQLAESAPKNSFEDLIPKSYQDFKDIFLKESFDQLPLCKPWDHTIELTSGAQPFSTKVYQYLLLSKMNLTHSLKTI